MNELAEFVITLKITLKIYLIHLFHFNYWVAVIYPIIPKQSKKSLSRMLLQISIVLKEISKC